jgi:hypothetical protein
MVVTLVANLQQFLKLLSDAITLQLIKESNMVDYRCMYCAYKLLYRRLIFNSFTTITQLIDFLMCQFMY